MSDEQDHIQRLLNFAYFYLKFRPRTKKEILKFLAKKSQKYHFNQTIIDQVVKQLEEENLVNDQEFVSWFIEQRNRTKPKGRFVITAELLRLGIEKDFIDQYFLDNTVDELPLVFQAAKKKIRALNHLTAEKQKEKLINFLLRRGFRYEIIKQTLKIFDCETEKKE